MHLVCLSARNTGHDFPLAPNAPGESSDFQRPVPDCENGPVKDQNLTVTWVAQDLNPLPVYLTSSCTADMSAPMKGPVLST